MVNPVRNNDEANLGDEDVQVISECLWACRQDSSHAELEDEH